MHGTSVSPVDCPRPVEELLDTVRGQATTVVYKGTNEGGAYGPAPLPHSIDYRLTFPRRGLPEAARSRHLHWDVEPIAFLGAVPG